MTEENNTTIQENTTAAEMTAGEMLRTARTTGRRKREIQTVAKQLCIREEFLQALEEGNYTFIPEVVYILGFARNYAMELGLNPDEVVAKIKSEMGLSQDFQAPVTEEEMRRDSGGKFLKSGLFERVRNTIVHHWKWFAAGLVVLIVAIVAVVLMSGGNAPVAEDSATDSEIVVTSVAAEPPYKHKVRERFGVENRDSANVVLQATEESWVKIEDARGNTVFSRVLVAGDVYFVPAGDKFKGTFGNAGGIDVWVDGVLAPAVGADHTRVNGVSMAPSSLMKNAGKKDDKKDDKSESEE